MQVVSHVIRGIAKRSYLKLLLLLLLLIARLLQGSLGLRWRLRFLVLTSSIWLLLRLLLLRLLILNNGQKVGMDVYGW